MIRRMLRAVSRLRRAGVRGPQVNIGARLLSIIICILAGFMIATSAINSGGTDLRPNRNTDLVGLIRAESKRNTGLAERVAELRAEVDVLTKTDDPAVSGDLLRVAAEVAGQTPVHGPALSITLTDAPLTSQPAGVDPETLIVHQQDIQAVVNALWAGGAEAMTIQGQRVTSRTGVKCVGNSVVLHGIPYAPPYVIVAIGDQAKLEQSLARSPSVQVYRQYADAYGLGYTQATVADVVMPAYRGSLDITARRVG